MLRALDLYCGAGGVAKGLQRAGFHVTGVDLFPQPRYCGDAFVQADALAPPFDLRQFDFIWASPVCKRYSQITPKAFRGKHPDQIDATRELLVSSGRPYAIENVPGARRKLRNPVKLCGSMFGLKVQRHRYIECAPFFVMTKPCNHDYKPVLITGTHRRTYEPRYEYNVQECRDAADIQWMTRKELDQAIPPAYSEYIGRAAISYIQRSAAA